jgi:hypothetical protein
MPLDSRNDAVADGFHLPIQPGSFPWRSVRGVGDEALIVVERMLRDQAIRGRVTHPTVIALSLSFSTTSRTMISAEVDRTQLNGRQEAPKL